MNSRADTTTLLEAVREGDPDALDEVFPRVYAELHRLAGGQRRRWVGQHTLNTTALVHEAYLKLASQKRVRVNDRAHFLAVAATAMRQILINYAEKRQALKRGGGRPHVPLAEANPISEETSDELLALDEALARLAAIDARQCSVVECRFFAGLSIHETGEALGVSPATVKRDWAMASAWLYRELRRQAPA